MSLIGAGPQNLVMSFHKLDGLLALFIGIEASCLIPVAHVVSSFYSGTGPIILIFQLEIRRCRVTISV